MSDPEDRAATTADRLAPWLALALALVFFRRQLWGGWLLFYDDLEPLFYPYWEFIRHQLAAGHPLPLWNPYQFCGHPFFANPTVGMLYPINYLVLLFPTQIGLLWLDLCHLWLATWGTWRYARHAKLSPPAAALASITFGYASCLIRHVAHPCTLEPETWFPWLLLAVEKEQWPLATLILTLQGLCGSPQILAMYVALLGVLVLYRVPSRRLVLRLAACGGLAGLMSAVQYLPFADLVRHAVLPPAGVGTIGNVTWSGLGHTLLPEVWGVRRFETYWLPTAPLLLALWAGYRCRTRREVRALLWAGAMAFGCAVAGNIVGPHVGLFRFPMRWLMLLCWPLAMLAGIGWDSLWSMASRAMTSRRAGLLCALLWLVVGADSWALADTFLPPDSRTIADITAFYQELTCPLPVPQRTFFLPILRSNLWNWSMVTDRFSASGYDPLVNTDYFQYLCWAQNRRLMTPQEQYLLAANHGVVEWTSMAPQFLARLQVGVVVSDPTGRDGIRFQPIQPAHPRFYLTRQFKVQPDRDATFTDIAAGATMVDVDSAPSWPDVKATGSGDDKVVLAHYEPDRLALDVAPQQRALLVLSETWDAGWHAQVDGTAVPIYRADWVLRAVPVPAGRHRVELWYAPPGAWAGLALSGAGWLLWLVWGGADWLRRRRGLRVTG